MAAFRVGAGRDVCSRIGSWTEVSIGTGRNVSVGTGGYGSIWAGRAMEMRAHRRTCDWGGRRAGCRATGYGHWWHHPLLVLKKTKKNDEHFFNSTTIADNKLSLPQRKFTMVTACWSVIACRCGDAAEGWESGGKQSKKKKKRNIKITSAELFSS